MTQRKQDILDLAHDLPLGLALSCWRGLRMLHPSEWEPGRLSGPDEPNLCIFVDRRYQRLQVQWESLSRPPDLERMYDELRTVQKHPAGPLRGVPGWRGLRRQEPEGVVVHAGRFFPDRRTFVQAVVVWPDGRDRDLERQVLCGISPAPPGELELWQALGLSALVPSDLALTGAESPVGRVSWRFRRRRDRLELLVERLALAGGWLKGDLEGYLAAQQPEGCKIREKAQPFLPGHEVLSSVSRPFEPLHRAVRLGLHRRDLAWVCPAQQRLYHVACWQRGARAPAMPENLAVRCCRTVEPGRLAADAACLAAEAGA